MVLRINKNTALVFLLVFYVTADTLLFGTIDNPFMTRLSQLIQILAIIICFKFSKDIGKASVNILTLIVLILVVLSSWIVHYVAFETIEINFAATILLLISTYCFTNKISFLKFIHSYDDVLYFLSVVSLLIHFTAVLFPGVIQKLPLVVNLAHNEYHNAFFSLVHNLEFEWGYIRNYGIFREPGVFQTYLIFGLLLQMYYFKRWNRELVYVVTLLSTYSTAGYIGLALLIVLFFIERKKSIYLVVIMALVIGLAATPYQSVLPVGFSKVFSKMNDFSFAPGPVSDARKKNLHRSASVALCTDIFTDHLIFGAGKTEAYNQIKLRSFQWYGVTITFPTDTFIYNYARYGLIYGSVWICSFYRLSKCFGHTLIENLIVFLLFMITLNTENYEASFFIYVLFWFGLKSVLNRSNLFASTNR